MIEDLDIPRALIEATKNPKLVGDYLLDPPSNWLQPYNPEKVDWADFDRDFNGKDETKEGLLCGAVRICNTGCEGYHIYVYRGPHKGTVWSDQRVPFGTLRKICDSIEGYIVRLEMRGRDHITSWESFGPINTKGCLQAGILVVLIILLLWNGI